MAYHDYWEKFIDKQLTFYNTNKGTYLKKGYLHFDYRIWFPKYQNEFKNFVLNQSKVATHPFLPFIKVTMSTKRIRFNKTEHKRLITTKERPICYAAHFDSLIYSFYATILSENYETYINENGLHECVLAYRSLGMSNIDFAHNIFNEIKARGECSAITLDITGFFDNLNHDQLKSTWLEVINSCSGNQYTKLPNDHYNLYKSLTRYSFITKEDLLAALGYNENSISKLKLQRYSTIDDFREKVKGASPKILKIKNDPFGIPQGSPISAVLSNIYMIDYDKKLIELSKKFGFTYRRYCDDIIVVCDTRNVETIKDLLYSEIKNLNLTIQPEKEEIIDFRLYRGSLRAYKSESSVFKNLQYLGFEFNGTNTYIRSSSLSRYHRRMKAAVKETIKQAYGKRSKGKKIFRKTLYDRFTHLGSRNFISYALRAAKEMESPSIKKQIAKHTKYLDVTINSKKIKREKRLENQGKQFDKMD